MTAKKGMLWKSPWGRRKGVSPQSPVNMWFFNLGADTFADFWNYEAPLVAPSFSQGPMPLWFGFACVTTTATAFGAAFAVTAGTGLPDGLFASVAAFLTETVSPGDTENQQLIVLTCNDAESPFMLPGTGLPASTGVLNYDWDTVTVGLVTVVSEGAGARVTFYVDNVQAFSVATVAPYAVPASVLKIFGTLDPIFPSVNGVAGGAFALTAAEIDQWFKDTRNNAEVAAIAGKTSDRWTATSAAPLAPGILPNLNGGQALIATANGVPTFAPTNNLVSVAFNY